MDTDQKQGKAFQIAPESLLALVRETIGASRGRDDDEHPLPPGPWDPVICVALERIGFGPLPDPWLSRMPVLGPYPEPWAIALSSLLERHPEIFDAIDGKYRAGKVNMLNPQPLPPRWAFLLAVSREVCGRAELIQQVADGVRRDGEPVGGGAAAFLTRFVDDWCGNGFRPKYPLPGPRPHWFPAHLHGPDLLVMATQFEQAAQEAFSADLRQGLMAGCEKLVLAGASTV